MRFGDLLEKLGEIKKKDGSIVMNDLVNLASKLVLEEIGVEEDLDFNIKLLVEACQMTGIEVKYN